MSLAPSTADLIQPLTHLLVVDDDEEISSLLGRYLTSQGYRVSLAGNIRELRSTLESHDIDLVVLDVMLPDGSGIDLCRDLRTERPDLYIILLTALREDVDRIIGLEIGADDYVGKPFNPRELVARIRAVMRRHRDGATHSHARIYRFAGYSLVPELRRLTAPSGADISLTAAEFDLMRVLVDHPGRVLSRDELISLTQGRAGDPLDRSIDVLVSRLRRKLNDEGGNPHLVKTIRNGGYQFAARVEIAD